MNADKIRATQEAIRKHQEATTKQQHLAERKYVPTGAGLDKDDLSKVMTNDVIGKGGKSNLHK